MEWAEEEILILVKAYPSPSTKYGETVCTAGVTKSGKWIRLYPIQYRDLPIGKRYDKFHWIKAKVTPSNERLGRPESYKVDMESIEVVGHIEAGKHWPERELYIKPLLSKSLEELEDARDKKIASLGAFRPKEVTSFYIKKSDSQWSDTQLASLEQQSFLGQKKTTLEKIPYTFHFRFICDDTNCKGHDLTIIDWELIESYRRFKKTYKSEKETLEKLKYKWFDYYFKQRESYFVVGTDSHWNNYMILSVYSPRRIQAQLPLGI